MSTSNDNDQTTQGKHGERHVEILGTPLRAVEGRGRAQKYVLKLIPESEPASLNFKKNLASFADGSKFCELRDGDTFSLRGLKDGDDVLMVVVADQSWEFDVSVLRDAGVKNTGISHPMLRPGKHVGSIQFNLGEYETDCETDRFNVAASLNGERVFDLEGLPADRHSGSPETISLTVDFKELTLGERDVTGDFVVEVTSQETFISAFEPPVSNTVHGEGYISELPAKGDNAFPSSGFGQTRERDYSNELTTITTVPVPSEFPEEEWGDDPRDTPPPLMYGEEMGPPPVPPFLFGCGTPTTVGADETTTTEESLTGGEPVYLHNGEYIRNDRDYFMKGRGPALSIIRTYRSRVIGQSIVGYGWTINLEKTLVDLTPLGGSGFMYKNGFGRNDPYDGSGNSQTTGIYSRIKANPAGGNDIIQANGSKLSFDSEGKFSQIVDRVGDAISLDYNAQGQLVNVRDAAGRNLRLSYNADGLVEKIEDDFDRQIIYHYYQRGEAGGSLHDLKAVTATATTLPHYPAGETTIYTYEDNSNNPQRLHNLVSITRPQAVHELGIDPSQRFDTTDATRLIDRAEVMNVYDDTDRVVKQRYNAGIFYFDYASNGSETTVTDRAVEAGATGGQKTVFRYSGNVPQEIEQYSSLGRAIFTFEHNDTGFAESTAYKFPSGRRIEFIYDRGNADPMRRGDLLAMEWVGANSGERMKSTQKLNSFGQVVEVVEPRGHAPGADPDRYTFRIEYDAQGNAVRSEFPAVSQFSSLGQASRLFPKLRREARYNHKGQVIRSVDIDGVIRDYSYYPAGDTREGLLRSIKQISVDGSRTLETVFELDLLGRPVQVTQKNGSVSSAKYDVYNRVIETIDPIGARRTYAYDHQGRPVLLKLQHLRPDQNGIYRQAVPAWFTETRSYDQFGRPAKIILGSSDPNEPTYTTKYTHDEADRVVTQTSNDGTVTRFEYGPRSLTTKTVVADGTPDEAAHEVQYDIDGQIKTFSDAVDSKLEFEYDWLGRLIALRDPLPFGASAGAATRIEYTFGNFVSRVYRLDRNGNLMRDIRRFYDERGRLAVEEDALTGTRAVRSFDKVGRHKRTALYEISGAVLLRETRRGFAANGFGEVVWAEDGEGNRIEYNYDQAMRLSSVERIGSSSQLAIRTKYAYNAKNRVQRIVNLSKDGTMQQPTNVTYDSRNLILSSVNPNGETTRNSYNAIGQLIAVDRFVSPSATEHETFGYDAAGNLEWLTDGGGNRTLFAYNRRGDRTKTTAYDGSVPHLIHETEYDPRGLPISLTDGRGNVVHNKFDEVGRLINRTIRRAPGVGGPTFEKFVYDDMNQLIEAQNDVSIFTQVFNPHGLVLSETHTHRIGGQTVTRAINRKFNGAGANVEIEYPGGRVVELNNDLISRPIQIKEGTNSIATFSYMAPALQSRKAYANGTHTTFVYDGLARLLSVDHFGMGGATHPSYAYTYDLGGNVLSETEKSSQIQDLFKYDALNRLNSAEIAKNLTTGAAGRPVEYEYDWAGNLHSLSDAGRKTYFAANGLNQYIAAGPRGRFQSFKWDQDFNLTESPGRKLSYDYGRNLIRAQRGGKTYEFTYNAVRTLIHKRVIAPGQPDRETHYFYDGDRIIETEGDSAATYVYGLGLDEVVSCRQGTQDYYVHQKRLWSVAHITDGAGDVVESYRYDPYGARTVYDGNGNEIPDSAIGNPIGFAGRWIEPDLGLYNMRARWYDYELGRFTTPDPDGWFDGLNVYQYAQNNPTTFFDPLGTSAAEFLSGLKDGFKEKFLGGIIDTVTTLADIVLNASDYVETLKTMLSALTNPDIRATVWGAIKQAVQEELADAWNVVEGAINALKDKAGYLAGQKLGLALGWLASRLMRGGGSIAAFFAKIGKKVKDILKRVRRRRRRCPGNDGGCFLAGTMVITKDGPKRIEDLRVGDEVLSRDENGTDTSYRKVIRLFRGHTDNVVFVRLQADAIILDSENVRIDREQILRSTAGHPYWVENRGWVHAAKLREGDRLISHDGTKQIVSQVETRYEQAYHYNIEVEESHTYFVTETARCQPVWVHNNGCGWQGRRAEIRAALEAEGLRIDPSLQNSENSSRNANVGMTGEALTATEAHQRGEITDDIRTQVRHETPYGTRIRDIEAPSAADPSVTLHKESKVGNSPRRRRAQLQDEWIDQQTGSQTEVVRRPRSDCNLT